MYENIQRGEYMVGNRAVYFRSKWEYYYACFLEYLKEKGQIQDWKFEPRLFEFPIKHGTTRYLPDFEITEKDGRVWYAEVKGFMDPKSRTKLKRMAKYYPDVKLVLVDKYFIKSLVQNKKLLKIII